ncbi:hypothetical protein ACSBR1_006571 [Camellia fascicularis]
MATQKLFSFSIPKTHFDFLDKAYLEDFVYKSMFRLANSFWVLACKSLFSILDFIVRFMFRLEEDGSSQKIDCNFRVDHSQKDGQIDSGNSTVLENDGFGKKENDEFFFGFQFQSSQTEDSVFMENSPTPNTSKYEVISGKDFRGFMEEPEAMSFTMQELFVGSNYAPIVGTGNQENQETPLSAETDSQEDQLQEVQEFPVDSNENSNGNDQIINRVSSDEDFLEFNSEAEDVLEETEYSVQSPCGENVLEKQEQVISTEFDLLGNKEMPESDHSHLDLNDFSDEVGLLTENQFSPWESESESESQSSGRSPMYIEEKQQEFIDEYTELEPNFQCYESSAGDSYYCRVWKGSDAENKQENYENGDLEDEDEFDILLKHKDMIEQMKMEMKNVRPKVLPTILEECESPKLAEDLKPLKIDEKLEHKDRVEDIQKVYKSYVEKMRKLDILNYQTLHAISFLQLKDPTQQVSGQKTSISAIKSLLCTNLWPCNLRRIYADPTLKPITEFHRNLELVYVGQACLSWEILHWQYGKAIELLDYDSDGLRLYNQVAGEFQQFQVLVQRFVENEAFQGPRVQNYAKNRFDHNTSLLQVPAVKDDCLKDKKETIIEGEIVVSIGMLTEIIDESMHVFWEFVHADRDDTNVILKGFQATRVNLQDPSDSELLMEIKASLQKKEKRLKDILRSGNCIVKKFQKHQETRLDRTLLFAQVELKLVSRVLSMSRLTTDQLLWCEKKLSKINFFNRKVHVEPSFLLFPF